MATLILSGRYDVGSLGGFPPGKGVAVSAGGEVVAVFNVKGEIFAIADTCSHAESSLAAGDLDGHTITCAMHGAQFDIRNGAVLSLPATAPVATFPVEIEGGRVIVTIP